MLSSSKRISLWLLPPEPQMTALSNIQSDIIARHPEDRRLLPRCIPHVTLIGGVPISECCSAEEISRLDPQSDIHAEAARAVLRRLQDAFRSHGGVKCEFVEERGVFAARNPPPDGVGEGPVKWNQSCVSIMERNDDLMAAIRVADRALFSCCSTSYSDEQSSLHRHFKAPLFEPHYSFVYGNDAQLIPSDLECPPSFVSTEMVVMWTYPPTLDGVKKWREIGPVSMA